VNAATSRFVEELGVLLDAEGYPRVAGRLLALLMVSPEARSLDDLAEQLEVSKPSISVNIRMLEQRGIVERVGHSGDRRDYYCVADDLLSISIEQRIAKWNRFHDAIKQARKTLAPEHKVVRTRLHDLDLAYQYMIDRMSQSLEEWRTRRPGTHAGATAPASHAAHTAHPARLS
jgi:DNA-binding transcriptional regulator GbsR (MarR family)